MRKSFVPERPCSIVEFTGYPIGATAPRRNVREHTDVHIVDARGRTVWVDPHRSSASLHERRNRARRYLPTYNGVRGAMKWHPSFGAWRCRFCGSVITGSRPKIGSAS